MCHSRKTRRRKEEGSSVRVEERHSGLSPGMDTYLGLKNIWIVGLVDPLLPKVIEVTSDTMSVEGESPHETSSWAVLDLDK